MKSRLNFIFLLLSILFSKQSFAECTSFCFVTNDTIIFGNNLDWHVGDGLVIVNKRNVSKTALWFTNPASWISKYGSITVNQWGREFPSRGINEAGLVIGEMTLYETRFPNPDSRLAISMLQWIQYQLDNHATIEEVIESNSEIRIDQNEYHSHFLVADSSGDCVSMEWLNGELVYHAYGTMPVKVLANSTYENSLDYYNSGNPPSQSDFSSNARFYRAADMIEKYDPNTDGPVVDYAFNILQSVASPSMNKWRLVFDITNRRFYFLTEKNQNIRYVDLSYFDYSCDAPVQILDMNDALSGNVQNHFTVYNYDTNRALIVFVADALASYIGEQPEWVIDSMANYPENTICISGSVDSASSITSTSTPLTTIRYDLPSSGFVILRIYNLAGRQIETLVNENQAVGAHEITWRAEGLPSGVYFYILKSGEYTETKKLILQK
jgi:penicillin V acylase-like amidase (Ntn superfamily)